jgi:iron complex transport system ATP-binding protein
MQEDRKVLLSIKDFHYSIDDHLILKGINLNIKAGEFVGLIGPNGAGKTTLLKCINGINKGEGSIKINDCLINNLSCKSIAKQVALMHQNTFVTFPLPVIDVVLTGRYPYLKRTRGETREDYEIARKYMKFTDTLKFEERPVTQISGGERQKVFFAKVLAQETDLILLDEPTASLDIAHEEQIFKYSSKLCSLGRTVIAAVHDLKIASRYCSRLVLMKDGAIVADGSPEEVLSSENLSWAYGVNALVYKNRITGDLDFYIYGTGHKNARKSVHVIGGGGSASGIMRMLFEKGFMVSAGVFAHGDSDLSCAQVFGIDYLACKPFSEISEECLKANIDKIKKADLTILCNMPFGMQNFRNLEAAKHAEKLFIVEDDSPQSRDFTGGMATKLYNELRENAVVINSARLHEVL